MIYIRQCINTIFRFTPYSWLHNSFRDTTDFFPQFNMWRTSIKAYYSTKPSFYLLKYNYVPSIAVDRIPHREQHIKHAKSYSDQLYLAGAFEDPLDSAGFVFRNASVAQIQEFVKKDPYVLQGLVTCHEIRKWNIIISYVVVCCIHPFQCGPLCCALF